MEKENKNVSIPLKTVSYIKRGEKSPVSFLDNNDVPESYKKEIQGDSIRIGYRSFISVEELNALVEKKQIDQKTLDTVKKGIYFITGIKDGKQFFSADLNQNNTFKDDKKFTFSTDVTYKTSTNSFRDSLFPSQKIIVTKLSGSNFYKDTLFVRIYPDYNYFGYPKMDDKLRLKKRLQLANFTTDNYQGVFSYDNEKYKVTVSKSKNLRNDIRFANYNTEFTQESYLRYQLKDTIQITEKSFLIDTLLYNPTKLVLKPLNIKEQAYGYKEGAKLNNYSVKDLKGNEVFLKKIANKKLLLLDFWGTWCAPCMELTPNLKELSKKYESKLNIVSLAYQNDIKPVQEYVSKNNLDWFNGIIMKGNPKTFYDKSKIIRELRVKSFPTFILVDKDFKIIFRISGGGENYEKLVDVIDKY
ncbi:TlpA family protein disulfide reductase [Polaribacter sp.]|uniref:TlpA family protein disulfide reductase n=1 Tax=Polaribacter sp. TaxID=1920175 RepID=UPI0040478957